MKTIFDSMHQLVQANQDFELVMVLESSGSTPRKAGAIMLVTNDGNSVGTIGGGSLEFDAINTAVKLVQSKTSSVQYYALNNDEAANIGMVCGGNTTLYYMYVDVASTSIKQALDNYVMYQKQHAACYLTLKISSHQCIMFAIERGTFSGPTLVKHDTDYTYHLPIINSGKVYIFGGGHISRCLVPLLQSVFFDCVVVESEDSFVKDEYFPTLTDKIITPFEQIDNVLNLTKDDYVVIVTRGHLHDATVLAQVLKHKLTYIGMIGSKTKIKATYENLHQQYGYGEADFNHVHAPIGIKIGGETPQEIAVSITAELIQTRHDKEKGKLNETN